jgi:hypothetical protein
MHPQLSKIENAVHQELSSEGFKKHKTSWTRVLSEVRQFVSIEVGSYTANHWLEFGVNLRKICDAPQVPVYRLNLRWRATQLMSDTEQKEWIEIKDLESSVYSWSRRKDEFARVARVYVLPTLGLVDSITKVKAFIEHPAENWPYLTGDPEVVRKKLQALWE